ncbi:MAG: PEGA domain-containing protein [Polyangiaceae bacterium]|nr:PEGA domain-containing protein [Polyangiaceae bacterium]
MRNGLFLGLALLAAALTMGRPASADDANIDEARKLARQALDDLDAERWEPALQNARKAEELYHAPIHLLAIARALEGLGRLAEAADTYERLVAEPLPPRGADVFKQAQNEGTERLRKLVARVPSLLVTVHGPDSSAAKITIDGKPVPRADIARRMDPGAHKVRVEADGYEPHEESVTLPPKGGTVVVDVTMRRPGAPKEPVEPAGGGGTPPDAGPSPIVVPMAIAFSLGAVGLGVGAVTGGLFLNKASELKDACPDDRCPSSQKESLDDTTLFGNVTTAALAVGGAGAVAGFVMLGVWLSGDERSPEGHARGAAVVPLIGPGYLGLRGSY